MDYRIGLIVVYVSKNKKKFHKIFTKKKFQKEKQKNHLTDFNLENGITFK